MKIYIVISGEDSEGGSIQGVFTDRDTALSKLDEVTSSRYFAGCDWAQMWVYEGNGPQLNPGECVDRHG